MVSPLSTFISHPLSTKATNTAHFTINTTSLTLTTSHNDTRQNSTSASTPVITATYKSPTTHILKTLCQITNITITSTYTSPPLCTTPRTSLQTTPNKPFTTTLKPKTTASKQTISPSEHLPFTIYFIPTRPNCIFKLNLPMNFAKLCTEIQHNAELSIIKTVKDYLTKQNKNKNGKKNKSRNKQGTMYYWTHGNDCSIISTTYCKTSCQKSKNSGVQNIILKKSILSPNLTF